MKWSNHTSVSYIAGENSRPDFRWQPIEESATQPAKIMQQLTEIRTVVNAMHLLLESGSPGQLQEGRLIWPEPSQQAWRNIRATIKRVVAVMRYIHTAAMEALCGTSAEQDKCTSQFADIRMTLLELLLKVTDQLVKGMSSDIVSECVGVLFAMQHAVNAAAPFSPITA